jgi:hypothetical protein
MTLAGHLRFAVGFANSNPGLLHICDCALAKGEYKGSPWIGLPGCLVTPF